MSPSIPSLMPLWVRHFPLLFAVGALPFMYVVTRLAIRVSRSGEPIPAEPWYARARALWPQQAAARQAQIVLPILLMVLVPLLRGPATATPAWVVAAVTYPCALVGAALATRAFLVSAGVPRTARAQVRGVLAWLLTAVPAVWLGPAAAFAMGSLRGEVRWIAGAALVAGVAVLASGTGVFLTRAVGLVSEGRPELAKAAEAAAAASGHRPRFVWEIELAQANALALPWMQGVLVTRRLLEIASPEEVESILRHELGHLREPWPMKVGRLALPVGAGVTLALLPVVWQDPLDLAATLAGVIALFVGSRVLRRFAHRMEHHADAELGEDHATYARALEKLYADNLVPAVIGEKRLTHPELYDRMAAAGHPPSWPRPEPPKRKRLGGMVLGGAIAVPLLLVAGPYYAPQGLDATSEWDVVVSGGTGGGLFGVARAWMRDGRREDAKALLLALSDEDQSEWASVTAAGVLAEGGFCLDAFRLTGERRLLESQWRGWLVHRLRACYPDGQGLVRETEP